MLWWTTQNLAVASLLAACVWLACRVGRVGPVGRHALWLVVLAKLLTPPLVVWPWAVPAPLDVTLAARPARADVAAAGAPSPPAGPAAPAAQEPSADAGVDDAAARPPDGAGDEAVIAIGPEVTQPPLDDTPAPAPVVAPRPIATDVAPAAALPGHPWPAIVLRAAAIVWLAGGTAVVILQGVRIGRMLARLRRARPADPELTALVADVAAQLGVRPVAVRVVAGIGSPFVWCLIGWPQLLWPAELALDPAGGAARGLVLHELAHVKRRDHWVGWAELAAGCVWWWNPLFWYVRHQLWENAELACDGWVVATLPSGRRAYAEALLAVCECMSGAVGRTVAAPMPAVGVGTGGRRFLERRLAMILRERVSLRLPRLGLLGVALVALSALPAWSQRSPGPAEAGVATVAIDHTREHEADATAEASPAGALPSDAREAVARFDAARAAAQREYAAKLQALRADAATELQHLHDHYAAAGKTAEAGALRDAIRSVEAVDPAMERAVQMRNELNRRIDSLAETFGPTHPVLVRARQDREALDREIARYGASRDNPAAGAGPTVTHVQGDPGTLQNYQDRVGQRFTFEVVGSADNTVWGGPDGYTADSMLATAAVHAGAVGVGQSGKVLVTILPGQSAYAGSTANGVTSHPYGQFDGSYRVERWVEPAAAAPGLTGYLDPLSAHRDLVGQTLTMGVVGSDQGTVWGGPDAYTDDSPVATAAVHAGVVKVGEMAVIRVTILPGQDAYKGSAANGVTTSDYGAWGGSYRIDGRVSKTAAARAAAAPPRAPAQPDPGTLTAYRGQDGAHLLFDVTGSTDGSVWGEADAYTDDSRLAAAVVHAGVLRDGERGVVEVRIAPGRDHYGGSLKNGVLSSPYDRWEGSYTIGRRVDAVPGMPPRRAPAAIQLEGGRLPATVRERDSGTFAVEVVGSTQGVVWGFDVYTVDSSVGAAAVHAGVLRDGERRVVRVTMLPGRDQYRGASRNGVASLPYGAWGGSFVFADNAPAGALRNLDAETAPRTTTVRTYRSAASPDAGREPPRDGAAH